MGDGSYPSMSEANEACKEWMAKANKRDESGYFVYGKMIRVCDNEEETKQFLGRDYKTYEVIKRFQY